jgi:hypothetical protein
MDFRQIDHFTVSAQHSKVIDHRLIPRCRQAGQAGCLSHHGDVFRATFRADHLDKNRD